MRIVQDSPTSDGPFFLTWLVAVSSGFERNISDIWWMLSSQGPFFSAPFNFQEGNPSEVTKWFSSFSSFHMLAFGLSLKPCECDFFTRHHSKSNLYKPFLSSFGDTLKLQPVTRYELICLTYITSNDGLLSDFQPTKDMGCTGKGFRVRELIIGLWRFQRKKPAHLWCIFLHRPLLFTLQVFLIQNLSIICL